MTDKLGLPLLQLSNLLPVLEGVYVHAQAPVTRPLSPGPYLALIGTGASHSWVRPQIGDSLEPHSLEGYVIDRGDGKEEDATIDVKFGFMKGLNGKPVRGWVQLDMRLPALEILLFSGQFNAPADLIIGMDILLSFIQCGIVFKGLKEQPLLVVEF
jgi:hypothetical protein